MSSPGDSGGGLMHMAPVLALGGRAAVASPFEAVSCCQDPRVADQDASTVVHVIQPQTDLPWPVSFLSLGASDDSLFRQCH